jgi:D-aminoacyl-tRNA deacylase
MLTVHFPGNWGAAEMGGEAETLNLAWASKLKQLFLALKQANVETGLNWPVLVEADHHGPTLTNAPIIYIEIGSSEKEWVDEKAGETVAKAVAISLSVPQSCHSFLGVGGGHYAREFCEFISKPENKDLAVGHILAKYNIDTVSEKAFSEAITKSVEKVERVILLKDSTNLKQKEKIRKLCEKHSLTIDEI